MSVYGIPVRPDWHAQAACRDMDPDVFFPTAGDVGRAAKAVCAGCDVRDVCLEEALERGERFGVFGGLSVRERRVIARRRDGGLPTFTCEECGAEFRGNRGSRFCDRACWKASYRQRRRVAS